MSLLLRLLIAFAFGVGFFLLAHLFVAEKYAIVIGAIAGLIVFLSDGFERVRGL